MKTFKAIIQRNPENGGCWLDVPFDVKADFGSLRPKVKVLFDGKAEYRGSLVRMGTAHHILGIRKDIREAIGKHPGDEVEVQVELDTEERKVEIPVYLQDAFKGAEEAKTYFESLSYTHQREYVGYILEAKKEETQIRRTKRTIELLLKQIGSS